jgi:hypothetical protein
MNKKYLAIIVCLIVILIFTSVARNMILHPIKSERDAISTHLETEAGIEKLSGQLYKTTLYHSDHSSTTVPILHLKDPLAWKDALEKFQYIEVKTSDPNWNKLIGAQVTISGDIKEGIEDTVTPLVFDAQSIEPTSYAPKDSQLNTETMVGKIYKGDCGASSFITFYLADHESVYLTYTDPLNQNSPNVYYKKWLGKVTEDFYPYTNPNGEQVWDDGGHAFASGCSGQLVDSIGALDEYQKKLIKDYLSKVRTPLKEQIELLHSDVDSL